MTITDQEPSAPATGESLLSSSAADIKHGAGNTKTTESASGTATSAGEILTGKQEHCNYYHFLSTPTPVRFSRILLTPSFYNADLKRELISRQVRGEIAELNSPTALRRFGAPFRSEFGEVAPVDSDLPILRYIFVRHVRKFPFLDQAREKEFWQDKLQVVRLPWEKCHDT